MWPRGQAERGPARPVAWDAAIYAGSALFALGTVAFATIPLHRDWGLGAVWAYAGGAGLAIGLLLRGGSPSVTIRTVLAVAVFLGAAVAPLGVQVGLRALTDPSLHAQSEAIITEEAARALLDGRNPYEEDYLGGPLAARPLGTRTHFPYLPGMLAFGLPRALDGASPFADSRVGFAVVAIGLLWWALRRWRTSPERRLRAIQSLLVLPTTTVAMTGGGDDLPVLALMVLSLVLVRERRPMAGVLAVSGAMGLKLTAWLLFPFLALAAWGMARKPIVRNPIYRTSMYRNPIYIAGAALAPVVALVVPFVLWGPSAFFEDVVKYPLGLGEGLNRVGATTPGTLLVDAFPSARGPITVVLVLVVLGAGGYLLLRRPPPSVAGAARRAGLLFAIAILLAPSGRIGFVLYPVGLLALGVLFEDRNGDRGSGKDHSAESPKE